MRHLVVLLVICLVGVCPSRAANPHGADMDDNDFAEFEDFEDEGKAVNL